MARLVAEPFHVVLRALAPGSLLGASILRIWSNIRAIASVMNVWLRSEGEVNT